MDKKNTGQGKNQENIKDDAEPKAVNLGDYLLEKEFERQAQARSLVKNDKTSS